MKQGSPEWLQARCGLATASCFSDVLAVIKSGEAASRRNYRAQLIAERLTGVPADSYQSAEMKHGIEQEPFARIAYEAKTGNIVQQVAFIRHPELMAGASPDGLISTDGGCELKCPNTATHIDTLLKGMSADHVPQVQGNMWMSGRQWWDFCSYDPRMPERMQLYVQRVVRDEKYIEKLEAEVRKFLGEVDTVIADLEDKIK
jgi:hypothetical protein